MTGIEIAAIVSAIGNLMLGLWGLRKKKNLAAVSEGMVIVESAIEENKTMVEKIPGGKQVTATIAEYGPAARAAVDLARKIADMAAKDAYESRIIAREHAAQAAREKKRASK